MSDWKPVARALLGTWPTQVSVWGRDALAAFCEELESRGVTPELALDAIRRDELDVSFPPSAAQLAKVSKTDPSLPTGDEIVRILSAQAAIRQVSSRTEL